MVQNTKLLKRLRYLIFGHLIISAITIVIWVISLVFFLKDYAIFSFVFDPFEIFLYALNISTIIFLVALNLIYKPHILIKTKLMSIIECAIWSIVILAAFFAMKLGVKRALDFILFYLETTSEIRHYENVIFISVTVFPIFVFSFIISILYADFRVYREIHSCEYSVSKCSDLDKLWEEEQHAKFDVNRHMSFSHLFKS